VTASRRLLLGAILLGLSLPVPPARAADSARAAILGSWQGTSTCVRPAAGQACRDEVVLYKFRPVPARTDRLTLDAFKQVGPKWSLMGTMDFTLDPKQGRWTSEFTSPRFHGLWSFAVRGSDLTGTLVLLPEGTVVRNVAARRSGSSKGERDRD
jgi:hypothetical protein